MKKILILAGTTEGRMLSEKLEEAGINHIVSVASEYGETMMGEAELRTVRTGKLDENAMALYLKEAGFSEGDFLVDATHPYAKEVTENAKNRHSLIAGAGFGFDFIFFGHLSVPIQFGFMGNINGTDPNVGFCAGTAIRYSW